MKSKTMKRIEIPTTALALLMFLGCGKPPETPPATMSPATNAAPAAATPAKTAAVQADTPAVPSASVAAPTSTSTGTTRYDAQPGASKMKIEGTSTMHDWKMESGVVGGFLEADAKFPESALADASAAKPTVQVFMPVKSFKSDSKRMDTSMYEYLKEPEFKKIEYRLIELKPRPATSTTGPLSFDAVGTITVVGNTITNTMPVTIEKVEGNLKIVGSTPLKCTDFKLKPFSFLVLSCGDDLKISFEWLLAPKAP